MTDAVTVDRPEVPINRYDSARASGDVLWTETRYHFLKYNLWTHFGLVHILSLRVYLGI